MPQHSLKPTWFDGVFKRLNRSHRCRIGHNRIPTACIPEHWVFGFKGSESYLHYMLTMTNFHTELLAFVKELCCPCVNEVISVSFTMITPYGSFHSHFLPPQLSHQTPPTPVWTHMPRKEKKNKNQCSEKKKQRTTPAATNQTPSL